MDSGIVFFTLVSVSLPTCLSISVSFSNKCFGFDPFCLCVSLFLCFLVSLSLFVPPVSFLPLCTFFPGLSVYILVCILSASHASTPLQVCVSVSLFVSLPVSLPICLSPLFHDLCLSPSLPLSLTPLPRPLSPQASPLLPSKSLWPPWKGYCKRE